MCAHIQDSEFHLMEVVELVEEKQSLRQPAWHVVVLSILTCFAYPFYWFYKTWRDLRKEANSERGQSNANLAQFADISPLLRAISMVIPIFHLYLAITLVKGIAELQPAGTYPRTHPLLASGIILVSIIGLLVLTGLPGALYLLSFLACVPLAFVQFWLNRYWQSVEPADYVVRQTFTGKELLAIVPGCLLLGLILASFFVIK